MCRLVVIILFFGVAYSFAAPSSLPPGGNPAVPLYVSGSQTKEGSIAVNASNPGAPVGLAVTSGSVVLGSAGAAPGALLDVQGMLGATSYCDVNGGSCKSGSEIIAGATTVAGVPQGAVFVYSSAASPDRECPNGYSLYTPLLGRFARAADGGEGGGSTGGSSNHTHGVNRNSGSLYGDPVNCALWGCASPTQFAYSAANSDGGNQPTNSVMPPSTPPYLNVFFCRKD